MGGMSSPRPHTQPDEIYCDESDGRGKYNLIGGLWLTATNAQRMRAVIQGVRERFGHDHEFKWKKASGTKLAAVYCDLAAKLTDQIRGGRAAFHCIVLERNLIDYATYHENDHELGYYKFIHWLIRKRIRSGRSYIVHLDYRTTRENDRLVTLKRTLNGAGRSEYGLNYDCCRDVQAHSSKDVDLLQATDILLGAVGWHYADRHLDATSSMAKNELADRIARGIGKSHLRLSSPKWEDKFNVWRWVPSGREK